MADNCKGITNDEMLQALNYINDFVDNVEKTECYWRDPDGGEHHTDVGYGCEFWYRVYEYLKSKIK